MFSIRDIQHHTKKYEVQVEGLDLLPISRKLRDLCTLCEFFGHFLPSGMCLEKISLSFRYLTCVNKSLFTHSQIIFNLVIMSHLKHDVYHTTFQRRSEHLLHISDVILCINAFSNLCGEKTMRIISLLSIE